MAVRVVVQNVCCGVRRAFHVTSQQQYARAVKRQTVFSQNVDGIYAANAPPHHQSNKLDDIIHPLNDVSHFEAARRKHNLMVLDGPQLISKALSSGAKLNAVYCSYLDKVKGRLSSDIIHSGAKLYQLTSEQMKHARDKGIVSSAFALTSLTCTASCRQRLPVSVVCDNIRDPGNMAAIITAAATTSSSQILVTKGCVDVMEMKVLRDAGASHFDIPLVYDLTWAQLDDLLPVDSHIFLADSASSSVSQDVVDYTEPDYAECSQVVLVVGGETEGLSRSASHLSASSHQHTQRVHIPMAVGIDSLNSAVSASVILHEIWRQIMSVAVVSVGSCD